VNCPKCKGSNVTKDGKAKGKQRYFCKICKLHYTVEYKAGITPNIKRLALTLYLEGLGFRSIERILGVSNVTVMNWVRKYGEKFNELPPPEEKIQHVEMDELWTFVGSKKKKSGFGWLLTTWNEDGCNTYVGIEQQKPVIDYGRK